MRRSIKKRKSKYNQNLDQSSNFTQLSCQKPCNYSQSLVLIIVLDAALYQSLILFYRLVIFPEVINNKLIEICVQRRNHNFILIKLVGFCKFHQCLRRDIQNCLLWKKSKGYFSNSGIHFFATFLNPF